MKFTSKDWKVAVNQMNSAQEIIKHFSDYEDIYSDEELMERIKSTMQEMNLLKIALRRKQINAEIEEK